MSTPNEPNLQRLTAKLDGSYHFALADLLRRANQGLPAVMWSLCQSALIILVGFVVLLMGLLSQVSIASEDGLPQMTFAQAWLLDIAFAFLFAPLFTALTQMGIHAVKGERPYPLAVFRFNHKFMALGITGAAMMSLFKLGLILFVVPGIYVLMIGFLTFPLLLKEELTPFAAFSLARRYVITYPIGFVKLFILVLAMLTATVLTFGFAAIWLVPLYQMLIGELYCDLFEATPERVNPTTDTQPEPESTFDA